MVEPVGMFVKFNDGAALGAQPAVIDRVVRIAVEADRPPVIDFHKHAAVGATQPTQGALDLAAEHKAAAATEFSHIIFFRLRRKSGPWLSGTADEKRRFAYL